MTLSNFAIFVVAVALTFLAMSQAYTLYTPTHQTTYYIEAARASAWPNCAYRFMSVPGTCDKVDLWSGAGVNQQWTLLDAGDGSFYIRASCGRYLSVPSDCNSHIVDTWSQAGINQKFKIYRGSGNAQFQYYIESVGRAQCSYRFLSFPEPCTTSGPDLVDLWYATGSSQRFNIHPVSTANPPVHNVATQGVCPDPYVWQPKSGSNAPGKFMIQCTGGALHLGVSDTLEPSNAYFRYIGDALGNLDTLPTTSWAHDSNGDSRWAPENYEAPENPLINYIFFADSQPSDNGKHRIGYVASRSGPNAGTYVMYSPNYMTLGVNAAGGDIDVHVFHDASVGRDYLVWKTDDNSVGSTVTRIWMQEIRFHNDASMSVELLGNAQVIMDSTGLWWVDSWVPGGSLVEGPEIMKHPDTGVYYLFFASGKYCQDTYKEGVARSTGGIWGPYTKMAAPLLSNGLVGNARNPSNGALGKLVGPGHASIVTLRQESSTVGFKGNTTTTSTSTNSPFRLVFHASIGENCNRYSFVSKLIFGDDGWPYVDLE